MGFLITCPNCGERSVYEYHYGGEFLKRPKFGDPHQDWYDYVYGRDNVAGIRKEWWYHRFGCKRWILAERDTRSNQVLRAYLPQTDTTMKIEGDRGATGQKQ